ncbi:coiled-coil domain-containing protein 43 [Corythoichthys intestinalis]|uniref:coiled-coil domain-containing protein 43 n=1 Tax=Corythoichthys intestinalis TaxID=161448 RepID=UPI0025A5491A|nr:coiled-coil domain-containing protein 43 [Corythoichthys intestinalis]XP_061805969.1 coiled-coil domain-containing protein 43-like [Nerophis lumbriciformis]
MAAPAADAGEFESWLNERLDALEVDREVYGAYILGVLQEEESDEEKRDALQGILSAFLDEENTLEDVCQQIIKHWKEYHSSANMRDAGDVEVQAIASMIEKQAQIVVKQKEVSEESKKRKEALLAQYANVTDEEDEGEEEDSPNGNLMPGQDKSMFKNTNVEEVLNRQKQKREQAREDAQKKKEMDKMQREKDKLAKQERKEKEKKRTQKGERKR